jgi:hypothetical protein
MHILRICLVSLGFVFAAFGVVILAAFVVNFKSMTDAAVVMGVPAFAIGATVLWFLRGK